MLQDPLLDEEEEDEEDDDAPEKHQRVVCSVKMLHFILKMKTKSGFILNVCVCDVFQERKAARASKEAMKQLHSESQRLVRGRFTKNHFIL